MVRKTSRSAIKAAEKNKTDSPKRTRTRASTRQRKHSVSEESDEDISKTSKNISPNRSEKGSSDNESPDRDSKKPFKKRIRGRNRESPVTKLEEQDEEVKEEKKTKGKSKGKNKSNNDPVNPDIENENIQVTNESPDLSKEAQQSGDQCFDQNISESVSTCEDNDAEQQNGTENLTTDTENNVSEDLTCNQPEKFSSDIENSREDKSENNSEELLNINEKTDDTSVTQETGTLAANDEKTHSDTEHIEKEEISYSKDKPVSDDNSDTTSLKKIKLKRPSGESLPQEDRVDAKEKAVFKKKITLKRPADTRQPISEELKELPKENCEAIPNENLQPEEWTSTYECDNKNLSSEEAIAQEKKEKTDEKDIRRKISLKRTPINEVKDNNLKASSPPKNENVFLGRSSSLQESRGEKKRNLSVSESNNTPEKKRRHSTAFENSSKEKEEKPQKVQKPVKKIKLNRNFIQEIQEPPPPGEESFKKYQWGKSELPYIGINFNLDLLKQVCPSVEFLPEEEVNLEIVIKEPKILEKERQKSFNEMEAEEMEKIEAELNAESEDLEIKENIIAMNRKISIVDDTAGKLKPPPSPAKNSVSEVLFITNLVRPFTVKQLKELLERTGKIRDDGFWTDRIKSKCYVHYATIEEAETTRNALHGVNWPIGNGKKLIIDFATVEDLENAKNPPVLPRKEKSPEKENKVERPEKEGIRGDRNEVRTITREWDLGKENDHRQRSRSRSKDKQRKHSRRSYTPKDYHGKKRKHEEPVPQKAMDDLFLKTKATPSIYWQPLSPEEIALKQQQRQERLEENKRRMEEIRSSGRRDQPRERDRGRDRTFRRR